MLGSFSGVMFWQTTEETSLDVLLKSENIILNSVLEDPYTLQELRNNNKNLINYLTREDVIYEMMQTALRPVIDENTPVKDRYRYSNMCTEVLTVPSVEMTNAIFASPKCVSVIPDCVGMKMNSLVASFFMKLVTHLFSRNGIKMLELLTPTNFVSSCMNQLEHSSIADLLLRLLLNPTDTELVAKIQEWLKDGGFVEGIIACLSPSCHPVVHYNAAYLYSEVLRSLRDVLYSSEDKPLNVLLKSMESEETISAIVDAILLKDDKGQTNGSLVVEGSAMLQSLLDTNLILNRPSHQLEEDRMETWLGGIPDSGNLIDGIQLWQADPERISERIIATRASSILEVIVDELKKPIEERSDAWKELLDLIVQLTDTNFPATHALLRKAFNTVSLVQLIELSVLNPQVSVLQRLTCKLILYILFSSASSQSPLLLYVFNETDIVALIRRHLSSSSSDSSDRLSQISTHSFLISLGNALEHSRCNAPCKERIDGILKACGKWTEVSKEVETFNEKNKMAKMDEGVQSMSSSRNHSAEMEASPVYPTQMAQVILHEFESRSPCQLLPSHLDEPLSSLTSPFQSQSYRIDTVSAVDMSTVVDKRVIDESHFDTVCNVNDEEDDSNGDEWSAFHHSANHNHGDNAWNGNEEWPEEGKEEKWKDGIEWDTKEIKDADLHDDWPSASGIVTSTTEKKESEEKEEPRKEENNWADFSSSSMSNTDAVSAGFASGLLSMDKGSSDC